MIKHKITNIYTGEVICAAEIDCDEDAPLSVKRGLAARWAVEHGVSLACADLTDADLTDARLTDARLTDARLARASLNGANLYRADLFRADLTGALLTDANLTGANLTGANLTGADLTDADLADTGITGAAFQGANLTDAYLYRITGLNDWIKCIQIDTYPITYTSEVLQIGCEQHPISAWREFNDGRIAQMEGRAALRFWHKYRDWIFQTIELCPAEPTHHKA